MAKRRSPSLAFDAFTKLPPIALVVFATRALRRILPCYNSSYRNEDLEDIDRLITILETYANGAPATTERVVEAERSVINIINSRDLSPDSRNIVFFAIEMARLALQSSRIARTKLARQVAELSAIALRVVPPDDSSLVAKQLSRDYSTLLEISDAETPAIDPSVTGPCGLLWWPNAPVWYENLKTQRTENSLGPSSAQRRIDSLQKELSELQTRFEVGQELLQRSLRDARDQKTAALAQLSQLETRSHTERLGLEEQLRDLQAIVREREVELQTLSNQLDNLRPQSLTWYVNRLTSPATLSLLLSFVVLASTVGSTLLAISEIHRRQAFDRWVRHQLIDISKGASVETSPVAKREALERASDSLQLLSLSGTRELSGTVEAISQKVAGATSKQFSEQNPADMATNRWSANIFAFWSSDFLLSVIVLVSGTIGAVIARLREFGSSSKRLETLTFRDVGLGVAAGFVTFLAIRGGKSVFLMDADPSLTINPYNSAFFGLLAGLFTDLAYGLLRDLANEIVAKMRNAFVGTSNGHVFPHSQHVAELAPQRERSEIPETEGQLSNQDSNVSPIVQDLRAEPTPQTRNEGSGNPSEVGQGPRP